MAAFGLFENQSRGVNGYEVPAVGLEFVLHSAAVVTEGLADVGDQVEGGSFLIGKGGIHGLQGTGCSNRCSLVPRFPTVWTVAALEQGHHGAEVLRC
jgi:hypothetical protein